MNNELIKRQNIEAIRLAVQIRKLEKESKEDAWEPECTQDIVITDWPAEWNRPLELGE